MLGSSRCGRGSGTFCARTKSNRSPATALDLLPSAAPRQCSRIITPRRQCCLVKPRPLGQLRGVGRMHPRPSAGRRRLRGLAPAPADRFRFKLRHPPTARHRHEPAGPAARRGGMGQTRRAHGCRAVHSLVAATSDARDPAAGALLYQRMSVVARRIPDTACRAAVPLRHRRGDHPLRFQIHFRTPAAAPRSPEEHEDAGAGRGRVGCRVCPGEPDRIPVPQPTGGEFREPGGPGLPQKVQTIGVTIMTTTKTTNVSGSPTRR